MPPHFFNHILDRAYESNKKKYAVSQYSAEVRHIMQRRRDGRHKVIEKAICLDIGGIHTGTTGIPMWRLVAFLEVVKYLKNENPDIKLYVQDPVILENKAQETLDWLTDTFGFIVLEEPEAFHLISDTTFIFGVRGDKEETFRYLAGNAQPALYIGNDIAAEEQYVWLYEDVHDLYSSIAQNFTDGCTSEVFPCDRPEEAIENNSGPMAGLERYWIWWREEDEVPRKQEGKLIADDPDTHGARSGTDGKNSKAKASEEEVAETDVDKQLDNILEETDLKEVLQLAAEKKRLEEERLEEKRLEEKGLEEKRLEDKRLEEKRLEEKRLEEKMLEEKKLEERKKLEKKKQEGKEKLEKRLADEKQKLEERGLADKKLEDEKRKLEEASKAAATKLEEGKGKPADVKIEEPKPEEPKSEEPKPEEPKPEEPKPEEVKQAGIKTGEPKSEAVQPAETSNKEKQAKSANTTPAPITDVTKREIPEEEIEGSPLRDLVYLKDRTGLGVIGLMLATFFLIHSVVMYDLYQRTSRV